MTLKQTWHNHTQLTSQTRDRPGWPAEQSPPHSQQRARHPHITRSNARDTTRITPQGVTLPHPSGLAGQQIGIVMRSTGSELLDQERVTHPDEGPRVVVEELQYVGACDAEYLAICEGVESQSVRLAVLQGVDIHKERARGERLVLGHRELLEGEFTLSDQDHVLDDIPSLPENLTRLNSLFGHHRLQLSDLRHREVGKDRIGADSLPGSSVAQL
mmetsp:Transcript_29371/g.59110  ORF Transcript_29371/g.59110 Transcript_29371/m.59110 type:complete len:215 (-) Transcript_29371:2523-3167(-)